MGEKGYNPNNKISRELTSKKMSDRLSGSLSAGKLHEVYLAHPTAQFTMTFQEFKRKNRKRK